MMKFLLLPMMLPFLMAMTMSGCEDEDGDGGGRFRSSATVYYYNQITHNGNADQTALTVDLTIDDESITGQGYSGEAEGSSLEVTIDDSNDNQDNSVQMTGVSGNGSTLFQQRLRLANDTGYTLVSYGDLTTGAAQVQLLNQEISEVASGTVRFRVINTVTFSDAFSIDVRVNGDDNAFGTDLQRGDVTGYQTMNSGRLNMEVLVNGVSPERRITRVDCAMNGGRSYDAILAFSDPLNFPLSYQDADDGQLVLYCHEHDRNP